MGNSVIHLTKEKIILCTSKNKSQNKQVMLVSFGQEELLFKQNIENWNTDYLKFTCF